MLLRCYDFGMFLFEDVDGFIYSIPRCCRFFDKLFFSWFTIIRRDVRICLFYHFAFM